MLFRVLPRPSFVGNLLLPSRLEPSRTVLERVQALVRDLELERMRVRSGILQHGDLRHVDRAHRIERARVTTRRAK